MKKLTSAEIKKIANEICEEEKKQYGLETNIYPITIIEYYKESLFDKKYKLIRKLEDIMLPIITSGFQSSKSHMVVIFVNSIKKILRIEQQYFTLVETCYHEMHHEFQKTIDKYSYEGFIYDIDSFIRNYDDKDYATNGKQYSFEIGAYLYGISKAKEYMKKKFPILYEKDKENIKKSQKKHYFNYVMYDASDRFEKAIQLVKKILKKNNENKIENIEKISPIFEVFLNSDMSFKKINEIIRNEKFNELDKRIIYAILSSKTFLESVNLDELSAEELTIISSALEYTDLLYRKQLHYLSQQEDISSKEIYNEKKTILAKLDFVGHIEKNLERSIFNKKIQKRRQHIKSRRKTINDINELIKKRTSKGYIIINLFYIIGLLITIVIMLYLFIKR
ncbi:MAG: hypothetical protein IJE89_00100 [Bacilli bacterium]|nr:hypothetical protein [Bacilli bacterium]